MANPRISAAVGPHAVYTVSPDGLRWCAEFARERSLGVHVHLAETETEVADAIRTTGRRPAALLDEAGLLGPRTVAAHGCWLDDAECGLMAKRGATVSHNPASNMKLATGRAMPYPMLKRAGARVALGTDGAASNNSLDLFGEMKTAALLQKFAWNDPTVLPAPEALALATVHAHAALGFAGGRLEPGAPADLDPPRDRGPLQHAPPQCNLERGLRLSGNHCHDHALRRTRADARARGPGRGPGALGRRRCRAGAGPPRRRERLRRLRLRQCRSSIGLSLDHPVIKVHARPPRFGDGRDGGPARRRLQRREEGIMWARREYLLKENGR